MGLFRLSRSKGEKMRARICVPLVAALAAWALWACPRSARALDVKKEAKEIKEKAKDLGRDVRETAETLYREGKEKVEEEDFWDRIPPYAALPAAFVVGILLGFLLGRGKKRGSNSKK